MGSSSSKEQKPKEKKLTYAERMRANFEAELARKMMLQREIQLAINIARARDALFVGSAVWGTLTSGVVLAKLAGKKVPPLAAAPIVVGAIVLGNTADLAYGNKLSRITKEAEYLLEHERERFVPMKQAPFAKFYTEDERAGSYDISTAVGDMFPTRLYARPGDKPSGFEQSS